MLSKVEIFLKVYERCSQAVKKVCGPNNMGFPFLGLATNVSVQLLVASMGSINTENMVRYLVFWGYLSECVTVKLT